MFGGGLLLVEVAGDVEVKNLGGMFRGWVRVLVWVGAGNWFGVMEAG